VVPRRGNTTVTSCLQRACLVRSIVRLVDDAAGGRRGTRAIVTPDLEEFLRAHWEVRPAGAAPDLGGSCNLNLLVTDGTSLRVARVHRPFVTGQRVAALQAARRHLARHGVPCAKPIPARGGRGWQAFQGRASQRSPCLSGSFPVSDGPPRATDQR
jgi:Ser/Thr protein kinase RdoA (MazF antagonist)